MYTFNKSLDKKNEDSVVLLSTSLSYNVINNLRLILNQNSTFDRHLIEKIDLFLKSKDDENKEVYEIDIKNIYSNPLFDKNMSELLNRHWKYTSNYFLDYNQRN